MTTILHSIDTGGPGGAETIFTTLAASPAPGVRHIALAKPGNWVEQTLRRLGVESYFVDTRGSLNTEYFNTIRTLIRKHDVDLVQSHLYGSNLYCAVAGKLAGIPVVSAFHGARDLAAPGWANGLKRSIVQSSSAALVAVSRTLRSELVTAGFADSNKLSVVYNGIDTQRFANAARGHFRSTLGVTNDTPLIGAVGNIRSPKGYEILVAALALVRQRIPDAELIIAGQGDGDLMAGLQRQIHELSLGDVVHLPGFVDDPPALLADLDAYCSSSHSEGFSLTCVEAMAAGAPVVATRSGGPEEILEHERTGLLVPTADPPSLADALIRTLVDSNRARERAERARAHVEAHFSVQAMLDGYHELNNKLLKNVTRQ
ncbi:MAG: glycosyltransferase [Pseudomonadota bacterium]